MEPKFNCSKSHVDIRDYSLDDALRTLEEQKEEILFAIWNIKDRPKFAVRKLVTGKKGDPWEEIVDTENEAMKMAKNTLEEAKKVFKNRPEINNLIPEDLVLRQYDILVVTPAETRDVDEHTVFIPLNPRYLEKESCLTLEVGSEDDEKHEGVEGKFKGKILLKDKDKKIVGFLKGNDLGIGFFKEQVPSEAIQGELFVGMNAAILLREAQDRRLFIGKGFTRHDVTLEDWPDVEDQNPGNLCAANAGVALVEYFERLSQGRNIDASRLFLHQAACKLLKVPPSSGVTVRSVVAALTLFGVPPEEYWPYDLNKLNEDPWLTDKTQVTKL
jgi:C1A family cysteine protease